eukprot:1159172-Pelagomonas_calceolata.AAC.2
MRLYPPMEAISVVARRLQCACVVAMRLDPPIEASIFRGVVAMRRKSLRCSGDASSSSSTVRGCQAVTSMLSVFTCAEGHTHRM